MTDRSPSVTSEAWQKALDCAYSIMEDYFAKPHISTEAGRKKALDEAMQHAFGMLSLGLAQGSGWQPIETAPKDGSTILIVKADAEVPDACTAHFRNGRWACMTTEDWDASSEEVRDFAWYLNDATHWMPRPTPPISSTD
jgi:hypothetical protein